MTVAGGILTVGWGRHLGGVGRRGGAGCWGDQLHAWVGSCGSCCSCLVAGCRVGVGSVGQGSWYGTCRRDQGQRSRGYTEGKDSALKSGCTPKNSRTKISHERR